MYPVISLDEAAFKGAAKVTSAFLLLLVGCLIIQGLTRVSHQLAARRKRERYDRSKDLSLLPLDRTVGNLLEWCPVFLGFFWVSMVLTNGATLTAGWVYVAARVLYPVMAIYGGIGTVGAKPLILVSTVPAYVALILIATPTIKYVFF